MIIKITENYIFNTNHIRSISNAKNEDGIVTGVYVTSDTGNVTYITGTSIDKIRNDLEEILEL